MDNKILEIERFMSSILKESIDSELGKLKAMGLSDSEIANELAKNAWEPDEIDAALNKRAKLDAERAEDEPDKSDETSPDETDGVAEDVNNQSNPEAEAMAAGANPPTPPNGPDGVAAGANPPTPPDGTDGVAAGGNPPTPPDGTDDESVEQAKEDFSKTWSDIKNRVNTLQTNFKQISAKAPKVTKNPNVLGAIQKVSGVMAGLGGLLSVAGMITSFINPALGAALVGGGRLLGGAGTLVNRGIAAGKDFKNGDWKKGISNVGMAAFGAANAVGGGIGLHNGIQAINSTPTTPIDAQGGAPQGNATSVPAQDQAVNQNPYQDQVGSGTPQTAEEAVDFIKNRTGGNLADWKNSPGMENVPPEEINRLSGLINSSEMGQQQINDLNNSRMYQSQADSLASQSQAETDRADNMRWYNNGFFGSKERAARANADNLMGQSNIAQNTANNYRNNYNNAWG